VSRKQKRDRSDSNDPVHVPAERKSFDGEGHEGGALAPLEGIETAMKMQAEILKRLHDRQEEMGKNLDDGRRSEMMIQSTRALNDSFSGMQRVQQGLMDRLGEDSGRRRWSAVILLLGVLGISAAVVWGVRELGEQVARTGEEIASQPPREDPTAKEALGHVADLRDRLKSMESRDQVIFLERLDKLRDRIQELEALRLRLESERDQARASLDVEAAGVLALKEEIETLKGDLEAAKEESGRRTAQALADQTLIKRLNDVIESLKGNPATAGGVVTGDTGEVVETAGKPNGASPETTGEEVADPPEPKQHKPRPVTPEMLTELNGLLKRHRSSEVYELTAATAFDHGGLQDVTLEVRGRDGSLAKVVRADKLTFTLSASGTLLELDFEDGYIEFRQGISRMVKSPFFNNKYEIVVLGVSRDDWLGAHFPFVGVK